MAVYYRTDRNNVYFCNAAKISDYTEWQAIDAVLLKAEDSWNTTEVYNKRMS